MKKICKRIITFILVVVLTLGLSTTAFAGEDNPIFPRPNPQPCVSPTSICLQSETLLP